MKKCSLLVLFLLFPVATAFAGDAQIHRSDRRIPDRYIVVLRADADATDVATSVKKKGRGRVGHTYQRGINGISVEMSEADAQDLARDPRVDYVEEDSVIESTSISWGLDRIDQRTLPLNGNFNPGRTGKYVRLYIFDTGVSPHYEFYDRLMAGYNATGDALGTRDCNGHGTHVASVAGGQNYGVAEGAYIVPVRVLDCNGKGSLSALLAGINWVVNDKLTWNRPSVANMSLAGYGSQTLDTAVNTLIDYGVTTVVAAGNDAKNACNFSPARVSRALTVGATSNTDNQATWSNYGGCVDIFAPGVDIVGAWPSSSFASKTLSGTSHAAPFVAGVAAAWLERKPWASPDTIVLDVLSHATTNVVTGLSDINTPNRLLCTIADTLSVMTPVEQLISDSGFENGSAFWTTGICSVITQPECSGGGVDSMSAASMPSHGGKGHASLGGRDRDVLLVSAPMTIPSNASTVELGFWLWVVTTERADTPQDVLKVELRDADGNVLELLGTFSNRDESESYKRRYFDLSAYRGRTVRVGFTSTRDQGAPTWFLVDDVELNAWH